MIIHEFETTGEAYDACQCDETIRDGDVLLIKSEGVVGLAHAWPCAVTVETGELHVGNLDVLFSEKSVAAARAVARQHGFELR